MTLSTIKVAVVDDQPLLVSAFSALVGAQPDMEVVLEAVNGRQAIDGIGGRGCRPTQCPSRSSSRQYRPGAHGPADAGPGRDQCHS